MQDYAAGGIIHGEPVEVTLHPSECALNRDMVCVRPSHHHASEPGIARDVLLNALRKINDNEPGVL